MGCDREVGQKLQNSGGLSWTIASFWSVCVNMYTYTGTCTHAQAHLYTHPLTTYPPLTHIQMHSCTISAHIYSLTCIHTYINTSAHINIQMHMYIFIYMHTQPYHLQLHTGTHKCTSTHMYTHECTQAYIGKVHSAFSHTCEHMQMFTCVGICVPSCMYIHTHNVHVYVQM